MFKYIKKSIKFIITVCEFANNQMLTTFIFHFGIFCVCVLVSIWFEFGCVCVQEGCRFNLRAFNCDILGSKRIVQ